MLFLPYIILVLLQKVHADIGPPGTPSDIKVDNIQNNNILLSWKPGDNGGLPQKFVMRIGNGVAWSSWQDKELQDVLEQDGTRFSVALTVTSDAAHYFLRMYAYNEVGKSPLSEMITFATSGNKDEDSTLLLYVWIVIVAVACIGLAVLAIRQKKAPPGTPSDITVNNIQYNNARLSWKPGNNGSLSQKFVVQIGIGDQSWKYIKRDGTNLGRTDISIVLSGLSASTTYYVRIIAYNEVGKSSVSELITFTTSAN